MHKCSLDILPSGHWQGAAVSLRVWDSIKNSVKVNSVAMRLVGVDGIPLQVRGSATVGFSVCGLTVKQKFILADSLTSQGILGMDFLESNHCILDLAEGKLSAGGQSIFLHPHLGDKQEVAHVDITAEETVTISPVSEMEIMGNMNVECSGTWLVEDRVAKKPPIFVARAVVLPQHGKLPIRVLNLTSQAIIIYKDTTIAIGESVEFDIAGISACTGLSDTS